MPPTSSQNRGLRSSCDKCHQTKLKCVPGPTGCQRCANLDLPCVYSPPGRSGRVPAAERRARGENKATATTPPNQSPSNNDVVQDPERSSSDRTEADKNTHTMAANAFPDAMMEGMEFISGTDSNVLFDPLDVCSIMDPSTPSISSTFHMLSPTTAVGDFAMGTESISQKVHEPVLGGHLHKANTSTGQCDCFQSIVHALQDIQNPAVCNFSLDAMLSCNKKALVAICDSLKCASSHDGTTRLVTLVVVQRALHLYRIIYQSRLRGNMHHEPDSLYTTSSSSSSSSWSGLSHQTSTTDHSRDNYFLVSQHGTSAQSAANASKGRLSLGSYQLDSADEASLTKQILILDLNRIPRLLERLDRRAYGPDETDGLDLYNILRSALVTGFRSLVMEATAH